MSAFIVSDNHINVIVSYFIGDSLEDGLWCETLGQYHYLTQDNAGYVAGVLMAENVRSVNNRYDEQQSSRFKFIYLPRTKELWSVGEIAKAIDCLEYQSCESADYYQTPAYGLLCAMRKHLLKQVAESEGVDLWEITELKTEVAGAL